MKEKSDRPLISIIVPTFNRSVLLEQSLASLVNQSLPQGQYEVIVIDDGSKDQTREVCRKMERALPLRYYYQENSGIAAAKNLGIFTARAPHLLFFDDDDVADQELLREHLKTHQDHPGENIAVLGYTAWSPTLKISQVMHFVTDIGHLLFSYSHLQDGQELDFTCFWGGRSSCKRSFLVKRGVHNQRFRMTQDIELGYRLSKFGLKVIFNRQAISYMIRPVTYDEVCRRCEQKGRYAYLFSRTHADPVIQRYCQVEKVEEKWRYIHQTIEKKVKRVHEIEALVASGAPGSKGKVLLPELENLYWWTLNASRIKGIAEAKRRDQEENRPASPSEGQIHPLPEGELEYFKEKWPTPAPSTQPKENLLVIDPFLPMFDRASGSLRLFHILKSLLALGYHLTFIARDSLNFPQYLPLLKELGVEVYAGDPSALEAAGMNCIAPYLDLEKILKGRVYQKVILDFWDLAEYYLPLVRKYSPGSEVIIDTVDIHFVREIRRAEIDGSKALKGKTLLNKERELAIYRKADRLWAITPEDKRVIENAVGKVPIDVIPNIHEKVEGKKRFDETSDLLFVGNFNHLPNRDAILFFCQEIFPQILRELPGVKLYVAGNNPPEEVKALASQEIVVTGYVQDLSPYLRRARISVNPLRYGAGMKGKIGEALSWGLPVVTTSIGAEGMGLVNEREALLADSAKEFAAQVIRLYQDEGLWKALSVRGKELVETRWSPESIRKRIQAALEGHAEKRGMISIVILTFNQLEYTRKCLASIQRHTPEDQEIILVDNGSTDGTVRWLRKEGEKNPHYRLIENRKNLGFAKGCNQGIEAAHGDSILLLNNDVMVTENWLSGMLGCLNSSPQVGIVGPMTNSISGVQRVPRVSYRSDPELDEYARSFREEHRHRRIPCRRIVGFCMLFRRELVDRIGLLDESFGTGNFEDDDFCLRAELAGYRNMIAGDVFVHHFGSRSFIGNKIDYRTSMKGNHNHFLEKWNSLDPQSPEGGEYLSLRGQEIAKLDYEKGQVKKAVDRLLAVIRLGIGAKENYYELVELFLDAKQYDQAFRVLEQMPDADRDERQYALLGYCQEGLANLQEAQKLAEQALSLNPSNAFALNLKGILSYRKGDKEEAEDYFQRAAAADPGFGEPHTNLGVIRWEESRKNEALQLFERGFILSPTITDILQLYHTAVTQAGEFARAEQNFYEAKALHPFHQGIRFLLIDILIKQEKYKAAMEEIEQAMGDFGIEDEMLKAALEVRKRIVPREKSSQDQGGRISLCMIVKDEENDLVKCIQSVKPVVDEIIVVDTGSADRTKDIATALGAKVFEFSWENDFSAARNFSISQARGDWVLILDADEVISPLDHASLLGLTKAGSLKAGYSLVTRNYLNTVDVTQWTANNGTYDEEAGNGWIPSEKVRLFPRDRRIHFENPVHELVEPSLERNCIPIKKCSIVVHHYGKLNEKKEKRKGEEYFLLGKKKLEKSGADLQSLRELAVQANILKRYEEAAELWHQVIGLQPDFQEPYVNLSAIYMNLGKFQEASATSQKAIELDPECKEAVLNYSIAEFTLGNLKNVISALENLLSKIPEYPLAMGLLSVAYRLDGEREKSQSLIVRIKKAGFNYDEYLQNTAKNLIALGRNGEAGLLVEMMEGKEPRVQFQGASLS